MLKKISFIVLGTLLILVPSAQAVMTKRADKECLLCHVLWFDAFKTDRKTLVEQQDTAIVVAGSRGLVSTEAMCITCHDGYVVDSRNSVEAGNPHHELKKKPDSLVLPQVLRLDSNNEFYCGTCHTLHDFKDSAEVGSTPFMRMNNEQSQMCIACHGGGSRKKAAANHPVSKKVDRATRQNASKMGSQFGPGQELICQSCHNAHGKRGLVKAPDNTTLCIGCHQNQSGLLGSKHDFRSQLPDLKNIKQQKPSESGPCGACHVPHNAVGKKLWARSLKPGPQATQMCLSCHGQDTAVEAKPIGEHSHPVNIQPAAKTRIPKNLPLFRADATKTSKGGVQCFSCHNVHQWNPTAKAAKGERDEDGNGSNSFLRLANDGSSALCVACHNDKQQLLASDHNLSVTAPQEKNIRSMTPLQSGPCSACHVPHNASEKRLWAKEMPGDGDWANGLCISCHNRQGAAKAKLTGKNDHPVNVGLNSLKPMVDLEKIHQRLPLYNQGGSKEKDQRMMCMTCHDPHTWRPGASVPAADTYTANIEGTAVNSFLRMANYPSPDLCSACHPNHLKVEGTVHDLKVSAPTATNLAGQTVEASGTCGACHLVHNSPKALRLWARDDGPVSDNVNIIASLCTDCHSEGGPAAKRVPAVASHPTGKLVMAHEGDAPDNTGYTPVFDENGLKKSVGNIGCPSCHDSHIWNRGAQTPANADTAGTDKTGSFRFLRNQSVNTICRQCHGPEGIFRYLYFHDPDRRRVWTRPRQIIDRSKIWIK